MKKIIFTLIVLLTLVVISHQELKYWPEDIEKRNQSLFKGVFALTWLGGYCVFNQCDKILKDLWDRQSFTIHGLWPAVSASKEEKSKYQNFAIQNIDKKLIDEMQNFWPPGTTQADRKTNWLWDHEYNKHGADFNQLIQRLNHKKYSIANDKTLQQKYFSSAIGFYIRLNLNKLRRALVNLNISPVQEVVLQKSDLSKILDISQHNFYVQCRYEDKYSKQQYLWQVKFCFQVSQYQDRLRVKSSSCPSYGIFNQDSCINASFKLIGFDWGTVQQRVTNNAQRNQNQKNNSDKEL